MLLYLFWGCNFAVMRIAGAYFSPTLYVVLRFALGAVILLSVCAGREKLIPPRKHWKWIALTGLLMVAGNNLIIQICANQIGAGLTAVLNYTQSIFVCVLAAIILKEPFTWRKGMGIVLCVSGLMILMRIDLNVPGWAMLLDLAGAGLWGCSNVIVKAKLSGCDTVQCSAWQMTVGAAFLMICSLIHPPQLVVFTPVSILTVLYGGALASAAAFFLFNYLLTHMEAGIVSVAIMAVPAVGVLSGILIFGEPMNLQIAIGMMVLLGGVVLALWNKAE